MKKCHTLLIALIGITSFASAETNALIEVKLFKTWVIEYEQNFGNLAIKNTGTSPLRLAKDAFEFGGDQLETRSLPHRRGGYIDTIYETNYKAIVWGDNGFFDLPPGETHVYEGRKFRMSHRNPFSEKMHFVVSIYLGNGFWLDSEPMTVKGVVPDSEEYVATLTNVNTSSDLVAITYKNERWLYSKSKSGGYYEICPVSLTNKIRAEPHEGKGRLYKIWDGEKSMIYRHGQMILLEGPDENDVFGKWTRERKQRAEADNAEVRRRKAEGN